MRMLFTSIIAFLFTILIAGSSSAQMMDHSCPENKQVGSAMDMANCNCSHDTEAVTVNSAGDKLSGVDCCLPETCRGSIVPKSVALSSNVSPVGLAGMVEKVFFFQPQPLVLLGAHRTGMPPPRLPSAPVYLQHCSFLI